MAAFNGFGDDALAVSAEDQFKICDDSLDEDHEAKAILRYGEKRKAAANKNVRKGILAERKVPSLPVPSEALLSPTPPPPSHETNQQCNNDDVDVQNPDLIKNLTEVKIEDGEEEEAAGDMKTTLEMVQERQKKMEAENRRKKDILSRAIADRKQRTLAENEKLRGVQEDLAKIDVGLTSDVRLLRDTIEDASFAFMSAQKRYDKAEKEYVAAKLHLHTMREKKELLAEHLSTIIEKNEERKAEKLAELMKELNITESN